MNRSTSYITLEYTISILFDVRVGHIFERETGEIPLMEQKLQHYHIHNLPVHYTRKYCNVEQSDHCSKHISGYK